MGENQTKLPEKQRLQEQQDYDAVSQVLFLQHFNSKWFTSTETQMWKKQLPVVFYFSTILILKDRQETVTSCNVHCEIINEQWDHYSITSSRWR